MVFPAIEESFAAEQAEAESLPRGRGETILVIDDDESILAVTSQTLELFGYRALTARDGMEGLAVYAQNRDQVAVVITDMAMPVMDGTATIEALEALNPAVKIVAASGIRAKEDPKGGPGARRFLTKPYTADGLLKLLRELLG